MKYEFEWQYYDDPAPPVESEPYIHFGFMLRFPDVPPGRHHVAHFCFNVLQKPENLGQRISVVRRGFLGCILFSKPDVQEFVETAVEKAFAENTRDEALVLLNKQFIHSDVDFSDEFVCDLLEAHDLLELIDKAFDEIERGDAITLHQATVIDDYGSEEDFLAAAKFDTEARWQDLPNSAIAKNPHPFHFLDSAGFRYYLPAFMCWSVRNYASDDYDSSFFTYLAVLPTIAPREIGRGLGEVFDLESFIKERSFTPPQVKAIYSFICFMAIRAEHGMDEDQYAAVGKWRRAAKR